MAVPSPLLVQTLRDVTVATINDTAIVDAPRLEAMAAGLYALVDDRACKKLIIDFTRVKSMSSSAMSTLIELRKKIQAIKGRLVLCGLRTELQQLFRITGVNKLFDIHPTEQEALLSLGVTSAG
ncbi:MAG TPA: STAS domain-containing protein [Phycisphaerae bacterium]|nr:STAS domain-containing protein [Phycisphaerae bacterium]HRY68751.1 STAS domain-containing protein [Phycisphaerae bacterium]HSA28926.1 STAS domain-containing protein [Phycisphaerae bacterium]